MEKLSYTGFNGQTCTCGVAAVPVGILPGDSPGVIFVQTSQSTTSVTNCAERIASVWLRTIGRGLEPSQVRFFEHYPKNVHSLVTWQEISFSSLEPHYVSDTRLARLWRKLKPVEPDYWSVDQPHWSPVGRQLESLLVAHV